MVLQFTDQQGFRLSQLNIFRLRAHGLKPATL